VAYVRRAPWAL